MSTQHNQHQKLKLLIIIDQLHIIGGVEKALVTFLNTFKDCADVDLMVWDHSRPTQIEFPSFVKRIRVPVAGSLRATISSYGFFSLEFLLSILAYFSWGARRKRRWLIMPRLKNEYDVGIAYSDKGALKCYLIDKVKARKKYLFYHSGLYLYRNDEEFKAIEAEYFPRFDKIFAVSDCTKRAVLEYFPGLQNISPLPNLIDVDYVRKCGEDECTTFSETEKLKLLTVGRICEQKNPHHIVETAKILVREGLDFIWAVVGDGPLANAMREEIEGNALTDYIILTGHVDNPYSYMSKCDAFLMFSDNEAECIALKEAAVFNKPIFLSDIPAFREAQQLIPSIRLFQTCAQAAEYIKELKDASTIQKSDIFTFYDKLKDRYYSEIFKDFVGDVRE